MSTVRSISATMLLWSCSTATLTRWPTPSPDSASCRASAGGGRDLVSPACPLPGFRSWRLSRASNCVDIVRRPRQRSIELAMKDLGVWWMMGTNLCGAGLPYGCDGWSSDMSKIIIGVLLALVCIAGPAQAADCDRSQPPGWVCNQAGQAYGPAPGWHAEADKVT